MRLRQTERLRIMVSDDGFARATGGVRFPGLPGRKMLIFGQSLPDLRGKGREHDGS